MARENGKPKSNRQLSRESGVPLKTINRISRQTTWARVAIGEASRFCDICGVDLINTREINQYMKRSKFNHIKKGQTVGYFMRLALRKLRGS